jgi:hypothetical protein
MTLEEAKEELEATLKRIREAGFPTWAATGGITIADPIYDGGEEVEVEIMHKPAPPRPPTLLAGTFKHGRRK